MNENPSVRKQIILAIFMSIVITVLVGGCIVGIIIAATKGNDPYNSSKRRYNNSTTCNSIQNAKDFRLPALVGTWILQEKLEFPEGMLHHNSIPDKNQTMFCLKTEFIQPTDTEANVFTSFYQNQKLTKNFTGIMKLGSDGLWDYNMLAKDHDGYVIEAVPSRYFIFVECVTPSKKYNNNDKILVPGSVFLYTRGDLSDNEMTSLRIKIEQLLKYNEETFLDFGSYCYNM